MTEENIINVADVIEMYTSSSLPQSYSTNPSKIARQCGARCRQLIPFFGPCFSVITVVIASFS